MDARGPPQGPLARDARMPEDVCAYCRRRPVDPAWRPFCSERCKLADLGRWLTGEYRVPGPPVPPHEDDAE